MIFTVAKNALRISTSKTSFALKKIRPKFTDNLQIYLKKFCESIPQVSIFPKFYVCLFCMKVFC